MWRAGTASAPVQKPGTDGGELMKLPMRRSMSETDIIDMRPCTYWARQKPHRQDSQKECHTYNINARRPRLRAPTLKEKKDFLKKAHERKSKLFDDEGPQIIAFVNSQSGGQSGGLIMHTLSDCLAGQTSDPEGRTENAVLGEVCDLSGESQPMATIERVAKELVVTEREMRFLICGGDGTVTWILSALEQCSAMDAVRHLVSLAIMPLGTGNDLARSLGWGGRLRSVSDILRYLTWVMEADPVLVDQWRLILRPHGKLPDDHKLRKWGSHPQRVQDPTLASELGAKLDIALIDPDDDYGSLGEAATDADADAGAGAARHNEVYMGLWQNYFSLGIDAKISHHVDFARSNTWCGKETFRWGCGKACYGLQALFAFGTRLLTESVGLLLVSLPGSDGDLRALAPPLKERVVMSPCGRVARIRQLMLVNINSYGAGLQVQPEDLEVARRQEETLQQGGTVRHLVKDPPGVSPHDQVLEVLGARNVVSGVFILLRLVRPTYLESAERVAFMLSKGVFMQVDGEPWELPAGCDVLVEPHRQVTLLCAPASAPHWRGHVSRGFWLSGGGGRQASSSSRRGTAALLRTVGAWICCGGA